MNTIQITIQALETKQEILISLLADLGAQGFEQTAESLIAYFPETGFNGPDVEAVLQGMAFHRETLEERNWNAVWESNFEPVTIAGFCMVRAEFHPVSASVEHDIVITPKMSFGTGHHATTYMMIQHMRDMDFQQKSVFDFGTGTGILAILAEKLGAAYVEAIDTDPWSVANATENTGRNNCAHFRIALSSELPPQAFDVILANINRNVILDYLPQLRAALTKEGRLLLSGLLSTDEKDIVEACIQEGLELLNRSERSNWISLLFRQSTSNPR